MNTKDARNRSFEWYSRILICLKLYVDGMCQSVMPSSFFIFHKFFFFLGGGWNNESDFIKIKILFFPWFSIKNITRSEIFLYFSLLPIKNLLNRKESVPSAPDLNERTKKVSCMYDIVLRAFPENFMKICWDQVTNTSHERLLVFKSSLVFVAFL